MNRKRWLESNRRWWNLSWIILLGMSWVLTMTAVATGSHRGDEEHSGAPEHSTADMKRHTIPGAPFDIFLDEKAGEGDHDTDASAQLAEALQTVVKAFTHMLEHRTEFNRFDEALTKQALNRVIIEPEVTNREGKAFLFLVARTSRPGKVNLLISASQLRAEEYVNHPDRLVPVLAREFQWVVSKADTAPKRSIEPGKVDLAKVSIQTNQEIMEMSGEERERVLQTLLQSYLTTVDRYGSLDGKSYYEMGTSSLIPPSHSDSTTKMYDIRVREALRKIVSEPEYLERTPKAVRSLLNGRIINVAFVDIPSRDWATRTRVAPKEQSMAVGKDETVIQPATVLLNTYRTASPEDAFYPETNGLPMGALPPDQLARVIAREIQDHITEKSMRGHTAADELTAPR